MIYHLQSGEIFGLVKVSSLHDLISSEIWSLLEKIATAYTGYSALQS